MKNKQLLIILLTKYRDVSIISKILYNRKRELEFNWEYSKYSNNNDIAYLFTWACSSEGSAFWSGIYYVKL